MDRAKRFGLPVKQSLGGRQPNRNQNKRPNTSISQSLPISPDEEEKRKKRAEKFKITNPEKKQKTS